MECLQENLTKPMIFLIHSLVQAQSQRETFKNILSQIFIAPDLTVFVTINDDKAHFLCCKELGPSSNPVYSSVLKQLAVLMLATKGRKINSR